MNNTVDKTIKKEQLFTRYPFDKDELAKSGVLPPDYTAISNDVFELNHVKYDPKRDKKVSPIESCLIDRESLMWFFGSL